MGAQIEAQDVAARAVVGTFQCQMQLSNARSIVITGHIYDNDTKVQLNQRIDLYQDAVDRQALRVSITEQELRRKAMMGGIEQVKRQLEELKARQDAKGGGAKRLNSQDMVKIQNGDNQIKSMLENIEQLDKDILEGKRKLGMEV